VSNPAPASYFYAILRLVPRVERGECFNVGVVMLCRARRFLGVQTGLDHTRFGALAPGLDARIVQDHLDAIGAVVSGNPEAGPMAALDISERFHWIASPSSTIIQPSPIHTGLTADPQATLDRLFRDLVEPVV
jgi:hypothetical protein